MQIEQLQGIVIKIIYQNENSWYSICDVRTDTNEIVTIVGIMPYIATGEGFIVSGTWIFSKEYGRQFKVEEYKKIMPKKTNEILRYLSSGAIKGIGAKTAQKIVEKYGEDSFDVIENHPDWLVEIKGISRKKAYEISMDFKEKSGARDILTFCNGKVSSNTAIKIHKKWGRNALGIIKENPYSLCTSNVGISFNQADDIANELGFSPDSSERIIASIKYVLDVYATRDGHTYVTESQLIDAVSKLISIEKNKIKATLDKQAGMLDFIHIETKNNVKQISLKELYLSEKYIASKLKVINQKAIHLDGDNLSHIIDKVEEENAIKYAKMQKKAIWECITNGVTVLTGGPGTGKTTIIKAVIQIFTHFGLRCALCAPTGRASKRMSEATSSEAKTIHRMLDVTVGDSDGEPKFLNNENNHLTQDVIIVDESSMIDVKIMNSLLLAIKPGARLILIGDINQLSSVGEGNVLNDIINSQKFSTVRLNEIFRQSENSGIVTNAHKINSGIAPDLKEKYNDFFFIQMSDEQMPNYIAELCKTRLPKKYGEEISDGIQIICPQKKGIVGTRNLNFVLQEKLNPPSSKKSECDATRERVIRIGDKIMQVRNNYEIEWITKNNELGRGVFNGEIGTIKGIDNEEKTIAIDFLGKMVMYDFKDIEEFEHSYAITVHKSQGSEYPIVIIPISTNCPPLLCTRNLIYTAITRASKMVILLGNLATFLEMIKNDREVKRNTYLEELLKE